MGTAPATAAPHLTGSDTSKTIAWSSEKKLSQRNFSLSWCIPLLVLLLAPIPAPGPLMFHGRTELPRETSACRGWGWNGKQAQEHPSGGGCCGCLSLPAARRGPFCPKSGPPPLRRDKTLVSVELPRDQYVD